MDAAAAAAPPRPLVTVACLLLLGLAVWGVRHYAVSSADSFRVSFRVGGSIIVEKSVGAEQDLEDDTVQLEGGEKYLWPLISDYLGTGNQLVEYISAAVVAHSLNRTLCLAPFQEGPSKHRGGLSWEKGRGLAVEERYNVEQLSRFVRVASVEQCLSGCNHTLDDTWFLRSGRKSVQSLLDRKTTDAIWSTGKDMNWSFVSWTKTEDVRKALGQSQQSCVALGGLFPGLRWRGAYLAVSAYLTASRRLEHSATTIRDRIIGHDTKYLAVHWRFEESLCEGRAMGCCFLRCGDGAIINTGLHPSAIKWIDNFSRQCQFHAVKVTKEDVVAAIYDRAFENNIGTVYLATDGWLRGQESVRLIKEVVELLRERKMTVVGLWRIEGLPNFSNGEYIPKGGTTALRKLFELHGPREQVNSRLIAGVEQELCNQAAIFLGSGQSTWSLAVFRSRLARRRAGEIWPSLKGDLSQVEGPQLDQRVHSQLIQGLLSDEHEAGILCGYRKYFNEVSVNATKETFEDEVPDGWLDLEACEMRIGHKGGKCEIATCITELQ